MSSLRQLYYDLFSKVYDFIIRLHSRDVEGSLRGFITEKANLTKGDRALDLCTGTGSVGAKLAGQVGKNGLVVGLDFSLGMLGKGRERTAAIDEVARVLRMGGRFCLMEHAKPQKWIPRLLFYVRIFFLGAKDARTFLGEEESIVGEHFKKVTGQMSPTGQSKLIYAEKGG
jgi:ubiquinone/menaquinone biosynthesis C-methylase UbiE